MVPPYIWLGIIFLLLVVSAVTSTYLQYRTVAKIHSSDVFQDEVPRWKIPFQHLSISKRKGTWLPGIWVSPIRFNRMEIVSWVITTILWVQFAFGTDLDPVKPLIPYLSLNCLGLIGRSLSTKLRSQLFKCRNYSLHDIFTLNSFQLIKEYNIVVRNGLLCTLLLIVDNCEAFPMK